VSSADLHCHSTSSDGRLTPTQLVDLAAERGLKVLALTDHDSVEGVEEAVRAAERHSGLTLIPGVEISTDIPGAEVHVLGYFLSPEDQELRETLARLREARVGRGQRMVEKLRAMGIDIEWERVKAIAGDASVGRPHVAQALLEKGHISSIAEAFDRFIGRTGPAYAEREKMTPAQVVTFLARKGYMPILAHPADLDNLDEMLRELKAVGLVGMEVYYQDYDEATIDRLRATARQHDLLATGGSDFHGFGDERERLPGDIPLPDEAVDAFLALAPGTFRARETR
jgi:predicted metal-dependent phosphoesterase TrpH